MADPGRDRGGPGPLACEFGGTIAATYDNSATNKVE